jgi:methyl halide transferase
LEKFSAEYWNRHYLENKAVWDIGYVSPPIKTYIDQLTDKSICILVPGAGNAYEVEYLYHQGFPNTYLLDFSEKSIENFLKRCPDFPQDHIFKEDYFDHVGSYDLIIEQTFFSSFPPEQRDRVTKQIYCLLNKGGKYVGIIFNHHFPFEGPPFGGTPTEYESLFRKWLSIDTMETATNSIKPRFGREIFVKLRKAD